MPHMLDKREACSFTFSVNFAIIDSTATESADCLYVASSVRIATAVSMLTDEKSPWSSC